MSRTVLHVDTTKNRHQIAPPVCSLTLIMEQQTDEAIKALATKLKERNQKSNKVFQNNDYKDPIREMMGKYCRAVVHNDKESVVKLGSAMRARGHSILLDAIANFQARFDQVANTEMNQSALVKEHEIILDRIVLTEWMTKQLPELSALLYVEACNQEFRGYIKATFECIKFASNRIPPFDGVEINFSEVDPARIRSASWNSSEGNVDLPFLKFFANRLGQNTTEAFFIRLVDLKTNKDHTPVLKAFMEFSAYGAHEI